MKADEIIARIETDKVTVDITSPDSGVITKYFAVEDDTVAVGSNFFEIDTDAKGGSAPASPPPKKAAPEPAQAAKVSPGPRRQRVLSLALCLFF